MVTAVVRRATTKRDCFFFFFFWFFALVTLARSRCVVMRMLTRALAHRWLEAPLPKGKKWKTLVHNGVLFAPPYEPHGIRMRYDGKPVDLPGAFCRRRTLQPHSTLRSSRLFSPPHLSLSLWRTFVRSFVRSRAQPTPRSSRRSTRCTSSHCTSRSRFSTRTFSRRSKKWYVGSCVVSID